MDESLGRKIPWFGLEGPACAAWRMWWWWSLRQKLQRNSRNYTSTWLFPADISGAQTRINIQIAPLFLGSRLSQQLGTSKRQIKRGDGWSFFRGNWLSEALFKMAGIQKAGLFWCAVASCVAGRLIVCPPVSELHNTAALPSNTARSRGKSGQTAAGAQIAAEILSIGRGYFWNLILVFVHFTLLLISVQHFFLFSPSRQI